MANISDVFQFITTTLERKERLAFTTASDINLSLDRAQKELFSVYAAQYGATQKIHDALTPFKKQVTFTNADTPSGVYTLPADYVHLLNGYTVVYNNDTLSPERKKITFVNEDEYTSAVNSQVRPPSTSRPIAITVGSTIVLYPETPQSGVITYLRAPVSPVYAYDQTGRVVTYNATNSVQLEFAEIYWSAIIGRCLSYIGVNLTEAELIQFGAQTQAQTT